METEKIVEFIQKLDRIEAHFLIGYCKGYHDIKLKVEQHDN